MSPAATRERRKMREGRRLGRALPALLLAVALVGPAQALGAAQWSVATIDPMRSLNAVSCPSESLCVAVDDRGNVLTTNAPAAGAGAWAFAHLKMGRRVKRHSRPWVFSRSLRSVSCASVTLCVAVGAGGMAYVSTEPFLGAASWKPIALDAGTVYGLPIYLDGVSCAPPSLCVAIDSDGHVLVSSDPAAGRGAWSRVAVPTAEPVLAGVACPNISLCVVRDAAGGILSSANPRGGGRAWRLAASRTQRLSFPFGPPLFGPRYVGCAPEGLCLAADGRRLLASTNPRSRSSTWRGTKITGAAGKVGAISCPTAGLCLAGTSAGYILTSADPAAPTAAWSFALPYSRHGIADISCPSIALCVAAEGGSVLVSTDPSAGAGDPQGTQASARR